MRLLEDGALGENYEFTYPNAKSDANTVFLKIFRKGSKDVELATVNAPYPKGIYMDVFAIDSVPKSRLGKKNKGFFSKYDTVYSNGSPSCSISESFIE